MQLNAKSDGRLFLQELKVEETLARMENRIITAWRNYNVFTRTNCSTNNVMRRGRDRSEKYINVRIAQLK